MTALETDRKAARQASANEATLIEQRIASVYEQWHREKQNLKNALESIQNHPQANHSEAIDELVNAMLDALTQPDIYFEKPIAEFTPFWVWS